MKAATKGLVLGSLTLVLAIPAQAQRGGGHGGFSGRGGGGRSSSGHASRGTSGPAGRQFRPAPTAPVHGVISRPSHVVISQGIFVPTRRVVQPGFVAHVRRVPVRQRPFFVDRPFVFFGSHRFHHGFGFPFCSPVFGIGFSTRHFGVFHNELACFPRPFFSPFFFPFAPVAGSSVFLLPPSVVYLEAPVAGEQQVEEAPTGEMYVVGAETLRAVEPAAAEPKVARPVTLLQLKDGSMYGLTDYWLEDGRLHYITSYGGENSLAIERVDLDQTVKLNWERGVEFVLRPRPSTR